MSDERLADDSGNDTPPILSYRTVDPGAPANELRTVAEMPAPEAAMARAKLEAEGIRSSIVGEDISGIHPLLFSSVQLQVMEADLKRAREVLNRPAEDDDEGEYADEPWRCPKCHRKEIDILPLSGGYRLLRKIGIAVFIVPIVALLAMRAFDQTDATLRIRELMVDFSPAWLLALIIIAAIVMFTNRAKRCRACGHEWKN
jgi:hypothetical protein